MALMGEIIITQIVDRYDMKFLSVAATSATEQFRITAAIFFQRHQIVC